VLPLWQMSNYISRKRICVACIALIMEHFVSPRIALLPRDSRADQITSAFPFFSSLFCYRQKLFLYLNHCYIASRCNCDRLSLRVSSASWAIKVILLSCASTLVWIWANSSRLREYLNTGADWRHSKIESGYVRTILKYLLES
jgi:hypothetical protein